MPGLTARAFLGAVTRDVHRLTVDIVASLRGCFLAEQTVSGFTAWVNWPTAVERAEEVACALALQVAAGVAEQLNPALRARGLPPGCVSASMGLHSALSVVSRMAMHGGGGGGEARPVAQGEAPSVARQLQDLAPPGVVVCSQGVYDAAGSRFVIQPLQPEPVPVPSAKTRPWCRASHTRGAAAVREVQSCPPPRNPCPEQTWPKSPIVAGAAARRRRSPRARRCTP